MTSQQKVTRRTIAKGAAWSVPVVAVAAAAPAASASTTTCDFSAAAPVVGATNCAALGVTVGPGNIPSFTVSGVPAACVGVATFTLQYSGTLSLALNNFGASAVGVSVLSAGGNTVTGTITAPTATLPILDTDLVSLATGVGETVTLTVDDGAGHTISSSMTFTAIVAALGTALVYASCTSA